MLKKVLVVAVIAAVGVFALRATKVGSHVRQAAEEVRTWAEEQVPPEVEIKRLRGEVKALDQDVNKVVDLLARENVGVEELQQQVATLRNKLDGDKTYLQALGKQIKAVSTNASATEKVAVNNRALSIREATEELAADAARYKVNVKTLEAMEVTYQTRERTRKALQDQLSALKTQKLDLTTAIDAMEAEIKVLQLKQMESKYQTDTTRLSGIKDSIRDMQRKIKIEQEKLRLAPTVYETGPATRAAAGKTVDEILSGLEAGPKPEPKAIKVSD